MTHIKILGIDPGLSGGLALLSEGIIIDAFKMPIIKYNGKQEIDIGGLKQIIVNWRIKWKPFHVWIEQQQSMPRQGVASSFRTGQNYGILLGMLAGLNIPLSIVRPVDWKRYMKVPADKTAAILTATRLLPSSSHLWSTRSSDGIAEAALIAVYGSYQLRPTP